MDRDAQQRRRHDGWTPERQAMFLAALEDRGCVSAAAALAGKSRAGAYRFRKRDGRFDTLWDLALTRRSERLLSARVVKLTAEAFRNQARGRAAVSFATRDRGEGGIPPQNPEQRQFRQVCRLSPRREAESRAIMEAGWRTPSQGRR